MASPNHVAQSLLLFCVQILTKGTYMVEFQPLSRVPPMSNTASRNGLHFPAGITRDMHAYEFTTTTGQFVKDTALPVDMDSPVYVLPGLIWGLRNQVFSEMEAIPFFRFIHYLPEPKQRERQPPAVRPAAPGVCVAREHHPWMDRIRAKRRRVEEGDPSASEFSGSDSDKSVYGGRVRAAPPPPRALVPALEIGDEDLERIFEEVAERRLELADETRDMVTDQYILAVRGGRWTAEHHGVATDSVRGLAKGREAKEFCEAYHIPQSATFSYKRYGVQAATTMARGWCLKMMFLQNLALALAYPDFEPADVAAWEEPPRFTHLFTTGTAATRDRITEIRAFCPKRG